jgi:hypothetical protein
VDRLNRLKKGLGSWGRGWPGYLLGGHVRTSTVVLIAAFIGVWWVYLSYQHASESGSGHTPATQVVPPGFIPDPNYTWVPRARLDQPPPPAATVTETMAPETVTETMAPRPSGPVPPPAPFPPPAPGQPPEQGRPPGPPAPSTPPPSPPAPSPPAPPG